MELRNAYVDRSGYLDDYATGANAPRLYATQLMAVLRDTDSIHSRCSRMYICNRPVRCALFRTPVDYEVVLYLEGRDYHVRLECFDARWYFPSYARVSARTNDGRIRFDNPDRASCFFDLSAPAWRWDSEKPLVAAVHYYMENARGRDCRATGGSEW